MGRKKGKNIILWHKYINAGMAGGDRRVIGAVCYSRGYIPPQPQTEI
jgi:hypothetical protein